MPHREVSLTLAAQALGAQAVRTRRLALNAVGDSADRKKINADRKASVAGERAARKASVAGEPAARKTSVAEQVGASAIEAPEQNVESIRAAGAENETNDNSSYV
eukprot:6189655-Pleurochrysis_carterae.AAC.2